MSFSSTLVINTRSLPNHSAEAWPLPNDETQPLPIDDGMVHRKMAEHLGHNTNVSSELMHPFLLRFDRRRNRFKGVGTLATLPLELRFKIYSYLLDSSFTQHYTVARGGMRLLSSSSYTPSILGASRATHGEAMQGLNSERSCEIVIDHSSIAANFMLFDHLSAGTQSVWDPKQPLTAEMLSIPRCRELTIGLQTPSPRTGEGFAATRDTVQLLVEMMNTMKTTLPPVRVTFETNQYRSRQTYTTSDFALLVAPLHALRNASVHGLSIDRSPNGTGHVEMRTERLCETVEQAVRGHEHVRMTVQQLCLDVKLAMRCHVGNMANVLGGGLPMGTGKTSWVRRRFHDLEIASANAQMSPPFWIAILLPLFERSMVSYNELRDEIRSCFGDRWERDAGLWARGHVTSINPFYDEM